MKTLVLLSGGIDSMACAHYLMHQGHQVHPLFVDYGQKAAVPEARAAEGLSRSLGLTLQTMKMQTHHTLGPGEIIGRNSFLVASAVLSTLYSEPCAIAIGIHAGTPYYDCSPAFLVTINRLIEEQSDGKAGVIAPFVSWSKQSVFKYFTQSGLPLELTYSCEAGEVPPCGSCMSCRDRKKLT